VNTAICLYTFIEFDFISYEMQPNIAATSVISVAVFQFQFQLKFWITSFLVTIKFQLLFFSLYLIVTIMTF